MKQGVGRTKRFVLGFFSWSNCRQGANWGRGELGNGPNSSRFLAKRTIQIDWRRERTAWDKLNSIRVKPTIATLIQCYNTVIVSG